MHALVTAAIYLGSFLILGYGARRLLDRYMSRNGEDIRTLQEQNKGSSPQRRFLLGAWYKDR
jgi:hypothetical protein